VYRQGLRPALPVLFSSYVESLFILSITASVIGIEIWGLECMTRQSNERSCIERLVKGMILVKGG
jgi:hypothetical protein